MIIVPLLRKLLLTIIIAPLIYHNKIFLWTRPPPSSALLVHFHHWFMLEWNLGLYPPPKRAKWRTSKLPIQDITLDLHEAQDLPWIPDATPYDMCWDHCHYPPAARPAHENKWLLAMLFSLTTPAMDSTVSFGTNTERICIDTGALACISTRK